MSSLHSPAAPTVLIICDGWGVGATDPAEIERQGNAVAMAGTPVRDRLLAECPTSLLTTSGEAVGLPPGLMGNSEVGHLNLGAGRIVHQDLTRINMAIADGSFFELPQLAELAATEMEINAAEPARFEGASEPVYEEFATTVEGGQSLIDRARAAGSGEAGS